MTRRDRCSKCDDSVYGGEVCCVNCSASFCDECVDTYNQLSRISKLIAFVDNNRDCDVKPLLTDDEIEQFMQDLHSVELEQYLNHEYPIHYETDLKDYNVKCREYFSSERNKIVELYEKKSFDFHQHLIEFISECIALDEPVKFICKTCFKK